MSIQKRTRTDGHLSREQYDTIATSSSLNQLATAGIQVADEETIAARRLCRIGSVKLRVLNKAFQEAVKGILQRDKQADLTRTITDYLTYCNRTRDSFLADSGQVFMSGQGDCGQLGFGTEDARLMEIKVPRLLPGLAKQKIVTVACGGLSNAALTEGGRVYTWGASDDAALGRQSGPDAPEQEPSQVTEGLEGKTIIGLASGDVHTLALDVSGRVYGWGCYRDKEGKQWFQPPAGAPAKACKAAAKVPVEIAGLPPNVVEVRCGSSFCLALTQKGEVLSWGLGEIGELGRDVCKLKFPEVEGSDEEPGYDFDGILRDHITPGGMFKELGPNGTTGERMDGVKVIGCGEYHSLVVARGEVYACGLNSYGQLGLGDTENRLRLKLIEDLSGLNTMSARGGGMHSLVLTTEGLFAFGRNDFGQVGCSEKINAADWGVFVNRPTEVYLPPNEGNPVKIACGTNHCLVITDKNNLYSWGFGEVGALGHGDEDDRTLPKKVDLSRRGVEKVLYADGGAQHTAIICEAA